MSEDWSDEEGTYDESFEGDSPEWTDDADHSSASGEDEDEDAALPLLDAAEDSEEHRPRASFRAFEDFDDRLTVDPPRPRSGHSAALWGRHVVYYGGLGAMPEFMNDVMVLDTDTRTLRTLEPANPAGAPMQSFGGAIAMLPGEDTLLVYGGQPNLNAPLGSLHLFDMHTREWALQSVKLPQRYHRRVYRWGHSIRPVPQAIRDAVLAPYHLPPDVPAFFVFCGDTVDGSTSDVLLLFRTAAGSTVWGITVYSDQGPNVAPAPRRRPTVEVYRDEFYFLFGGRSKNRTFDDLWLYAPLVNAWAKVVGPSQRDVLGVLLANPVSQATDKPSAKDLQSRLMAKLHDRGLAAPAPNPRPLARTGHTMVLAFDTLWVFTGFYVNFSRGEELRTVNDLWAFDLSTFVWREVLPSRDDEHLDSMDGFPARRFTEVREPWALPSPTEVDCPGPRTLSMSTATFIPGTNAVVTWGGRRNEVPLFDGYVMNLWPRRRTLKELAGRWLKWGARDQAAEYAKHHDLTRVLDNTG